MNLSPNKTASFGLVAQAVDQIRDVMQKHPEVEECIIYGSRAKGNFRNNSDIDLTLKGTALTFSDLLRIESELDDLLLPFQIDLSLFDKIDNRELLDHIERVGKTFYLKETIDFNPVGSK